MIHEERLDAALPNYKKDPNSNMNVQDYVLSSDKEPAALKSVFRTANILSCLSKGIDSITEIATVCKLNKSTIHRLLKALGEARITMRDPITRRYYIGPLIAEIASNPYFTHEHLGLCAINEMRYLSDFTGESIGLNVLIGLQNVLLHEIPSTYDLQIVAKKRISSNIHAGAASKVLLSQLDTKKLKIIMANLTLEPLTERTVTDKDELVAGVQHEIDLLDKKAEKSKGYTRKKAEDTLKTDVYASLDKAEFRITADIVADLADQYADLTAAKVTARLTALVKDGLVIKQDVKTEDKRTVKGYKLA